MNWFKRHLNWSLFLSSVVAIILVYTGASIMGAGESNWPIFVSLLVISVTFMLWVEIWYLRQKGRSLWNLFQNLLPYPLSLIMLLKLRNQREGQREFHSGWRDIHNWWRDTY